METLGLLPGDPLDVDDSGLVHAVPGGWLYAAGDVTGRAPLTHQGKYAARVVGDVIAARAAGADVRARPWTAYAATADHHAVPQVVFTAGGRSPMPSSAASCEPDEGDWASAVEGRGAVWEWSAAWTPISGGIVGRGCRWRWCTSSRTTRART
jgi:hypothetical protein